MVRFEAVIGFYADDNFSSWEEHTERGVACGPTPADALNQIEEMYGDDLIEVKIMYDDTMSDKCYTECDDTPWIRKEN